ncbi:MAG TPA: hypothetical protein VK208_05265 [Pyrinomonadaceae bacterium]|nr:hypothetical protein [Pyrinomonadaceae bacterium]
MSQPQSVLATLRNAMSIFGEAMILGAVFTAGGDETRSLLLLAIEHAGGVNIARSRRRSGRRR